MPLLVNGDGGDMMLSGLGNGQFHSACGDRVAKPPVAIDVGGGWRFALDLKWGAGHNMPTLDTRNAGRQQNNAVRVMSGQVRPHQVLHNNLGLRCGGPGSLKQRGTNTV
jgi:hypothetical protein